MLPVDRIMYKVDKILVDNQVIVHRMRENTLITMSSMMVNAYLNINS
jgi:hypothetical protein